MRKKFENIEHDDKTATVWPKLGARVEGMTKGMSGGRAHVISEPTI